MSVRLGSLSWLPLLLLIPGGCSSAWSVVYVEQKVCAVRNTTAVLQCSFTYPDGHNVKEVKWARGHKDNFYHGPFFFDTNKNDSSKFLYIGDQVKNCSLKIHQAEQTDAGRYAFRFITDKDKYSGVDGLELQVTDLKLLLSSGNRTVKEGDSLNLTCRNECDGTKSYSSFTWFKNGQPLKNGPVLGLISVSSEDSGNYSCSLSKHKGTTSGELYINVEYGPKKTSVSVRPSMEVDSGTNFTLTCSSQANPTVEGYVWFEVIEDEVKKVENQPVFVSSVEGQFFCRANNKHGSQNSSVVTLTVKEPAATSTDKTAIIIFIVVLLLVVLIISSITWFKTKRSTHSAEENTQAEVRMVLPPFRPVLLTQYVQRGVEKKTKLYVFVSLHVCVAVSRAQCMPTGRPLRVTTNHKLDMTVTEERHRLRSSMPALSLAPRKCNKRGSNKRILMMGPRFTAEWPCEPQQGNSPCWSGYCSWFDISESKLRLGVCGIYTFALFLQMLLFVKANVQL